MVYLPKSPITHPCLEIEKAKANGTYHCGQVLETLKNDFKNKCYVCETKEPHLINIEHFKPHKGDKDLMFDWNNLFFCCGHCNTTKRVYDDILNCTLEQDGVDTKIKYEITLFPETHVKIIALENTSKVTNTAKLLNDVFNGTTTLKQIQADNIRKTLKSAIIKFQYLLSEYANDIYSENEKSDIKDEIINELLNSSSYTAFKRWIIRENDYLKPDFSEYL